jgi:hypothetical protein
MWYVCCEVFDVLTLLPDRNTVITGYELPDSGLHI